MEFKVFTLNCWGLAVVSKHRTARIHAIAEMLATSTYDVVCLQEVWLDSDFELIKSKTSGMLPYSHYFHSGVTGSGICILSRHVIEDVFFHQWPVNGYIHKIHHGDWFGGKGVGLCRLRVNDYTVNVYSAHLHAEYNREHDDYHAHRVLQAFDTAQFIQLTSRNVDLVVLAGDLNTEPGDLTYKLLLTVPGLVDAFTGAADDVRVATNECLCNSYTASALVKNNIPGKRIDYIMYHPGDKMHIDLIDYELPLPQRVPDCAFSYSDHEAIAVTFIIKERQVKVDDFDADLQKEVLEESIDVCDEALKALTRHRYLYCFFSLVLLILLVITLVVKVPNTFDVPYNILKVVLTFFMFYALMMAILWNRIERHAVIAAKLGMETNLKFVKARQNS